LSLKKPIIIDLHRKKWYNLYKIFSGRIRNYRFIVSKTRGDYMNKYVAFGHGQPEVGYVLTHFERLNGTGMQQCDYSTEIKSAKRLCAQIWLVRTVNTLYLYFDRWVQRSKDPTDIKFIENMEEQNVLVGTASFVPKEKSTVAVRILTGDSHEPVKVVEVTPTKIERVKSRDVYLVYTDTKDYFVLVSKR